jgi:hypothetical protein
LDKHSHDQKRKTITRVRRKPITSTFVSVSSYIGFGVATSRPGEGQVGRIAMKDATSPYVFDAREAMALKEFMGQM